MTDYEVYDATVRGDIGEDGHWQVLVESYLLSIGSYTRSRPQLDIAARNIMSRDEAVEEARRIAFEFDPPHPWRVQRRRVFRSGDDFVVEAQGSGTPLAFRVFVAQYLGERDG